jgi:hypothetical protein
MPFSETEVPQKDLLDAEKLFNLREQISRSESEARAQIAAKVIELVVALNVALFCLVLYALHLDQTNLENRYYFDQIVTDRVIGWMIAGFVFEIAAAFACFVRFPSIRRRDVDR